MDRIKSDSQLNREALRKLRMMKHAIDSAQLIENSHELVAILISYFDRLKNGFVCGNYVDLDSDTILLISAVIFDPDVKLLLPELAIRKLVQDFKLIHAYSRCVARVYRLLSELEFSISEESLKKLQLEVSLQVSNTGLYDMEYKLHAVFVQNLLRLLNEKLKQDYVIIKAINDHMQVENVAVV